MAAIASRWIRLPVAALALVVAASMGYRAAGLPREPYLGMSERPGSVGLVFAGGPAEGAGLRSGDEIVRVNGIALTSSRDLPAMLRRDGPDKGIFLTLQRGDSTFTTDLVPVPLPMGEIIWLAAHALVAIVTLFIGTLVFLRKASRLTGAFCGLCLILAMLLFRPWVPPGAMGERLDILVREIASALIPGMLLHFFLLFPWEHAVLRRRPWLQFVPYVPGVLILAAPRVAARFGGRDVADPQRLSRITATTADLAFLAALIISVILFWGAYRRSTVPTVRRKLKVTLAGTIVGLLPVLLVSALHTAYRGAELPADRVATLALFLLPASFGYAIVRHGIFELEFLVKRSLAWTAVTGGAVLFYLALNFALRKLAQGAGASDVHLGGALAVAFVILLMSPLRGRLQEKIDRWIDPDRADTARAVRDAGEVLRSASGLEETECSVLSSVQDLLGTTRAGFFRPEPGADSYRLTHILEPDGREAPALSGEAQRTPAPESPVAVAAPPGHALGRLAAETLFALGRPALRGDFEAELPYGYLPQGDLVALARLGTRVLVPLTAGPRRLGLLVLGPRAFDTPYADADLNLLEGLQTQASLALESAHYARDSAYSEGLHQELALAGSIQQKLLPGKLPELARFDIAASTVPCREIGGDFYDCVRESSGDLALAIGDVTGKGIPAALVMASLQATFRAELATGLPPREVASRVNRSLCALDPPQRFVTFFFGRLDLDRSLLAYTNAGHLHPMLIRADGHTERLGCGGLLLGVMEETKYEDEVVPLRPGDLLLLFTDGVIERGGPETLFEEPELLQVASDHRHLSASDLLGRILEELEHGAGAPADDDTTLVVLKAL